MATTTTSRSLETATTTTRTMSKTQHGQHPQRTTKEMAADDEGDAVYTPTCFNLYHCELQGTNDSYQSQVFFFMFFSCFSRNQHFHFYY
jgi:hypothetical protein